jgi:hypothetical protein
MARNRRCGNWYGIVTHRAVGGPTSGNFAIYISSRKWALGFVYRPDFLRILFGPIHICVDIDRPQKRNTSPGFRGRSVKESPSRSRTEKNGEGVNLEVQFSGDATEMEKQIRKLRMAEELTTHEPEAH